MKQHRQSYISISWLVAAAFALASAGALAGDVGKITAGGRSAGEVQGRASGSLPGAGNQSVRATGPHLVSEMLGRGNQTAKEPGAPIAAGATEIGDFGRSSMTLAARNGKQGQEGITVAARK